MFEIPSIPQGDDQAGGHIESGQEIKIGRPLDGFDPENLERPLASEHGTLRFKGRPYANSETTLLFVNEDESFGAEVSIEDGVVRNTVKGHAGVASGGARKA